MSAVGTALFLFCEMDAGWMSDGRSLGWLWNVLDCDGLLDKRLGASISIAP